MNKKKVCCVIFSRANYGSIKSVILEIKKSKKLILQLIVGGTAIVEKYGSLIAQIKKDKFKIDQELSFIIEGETNLTMTKSTGLAIIEISTALEKLKPNLVVTVGDRYETMATAIAAAYMNIPLAHTMGGEVSGTIDESIRHAITKFSHIHFAATKKAKNNIIKMGEYKKNVFNVGCPRIDLVKKIINKNSFNIQKKIFKDGVGSKFQLKPKNYICVMQYPVTTEYENTEKQMFETLKALSKINYPKIIFWPNSDAGSNKIAGAIRMWRELNNPKDMWFLKNLDPETFYELLNKSLVLVGNTSSGIREGSYMGLPYVNIGTRQNQRELGFNTIKTNNNEKNIIKSINKILKLKIKKSKIYGNGNAGKKIVKIIENLKNINIQKKLNYS